MVKYCSVCKKTWNGIDDRKFHTFPENDENLRKKWIEALSLDESKVTKYFYVCSDHFDKTSYYIPYTLIGKKMLTRGSVPFIKGHSENVSDSNGLSEPQELFTDNCQKNDFYNQHPSASLAFRSLTDQSEEYFIEQDFVSSKKAEANKLLERPSTSFSSVETNKDSLPPGKVVNSNTNNVKLKKMANSEQGIKCNMESVQASNSTDTNLENSDINCAVDSTNSDSELREENVTTACKPLGQTLLTSYKAKGRRIRKTMRRRRGTQFCWNNRQQSLHRALFINDDAYETFVKYSAFQQKTIRDKTKNMAKKLYRRQKKIDRLEAMAVKLKREKKESVAEEYQGLPPLIEDILNRLKSNKPTKAFSPFMQAFAKSVHGCSASTYEIMRNKFLNCLPHPKALANWNKSKLKILQKEQALTHIT